VFFGSALTNFGVREMLDGFVENAPPPRRAAATRERVAPEEEAVQRLRVQDPGEHGPAHRDRIAFLRVCSGSTARA
jgi:peptide chain release factor 3